MDDHIRVANDVLSTLENLNITRPANIHEWNHYRGIIMNTLSTLRFWIEQHNAARIVELDTRLVDFTNKALKYIEGYLNHD